MTRTKDYSIWFDPDKGGIRLARPYNGARHEDPRTSFRICNGKVLITQFEDGEFESLEIIEGPGVGLTLDSWAARTPK